MKPLYQIEQNYITIIDSIIEAGGEITEEQSSQLVILKEELQTKGVSYGLAVKQIESEIGIIDSEIERLKKSKQVRQKAVERFKSHLLLAMVQFDINKIENPLIKITTRSSKSVEVFVNLDSQFIKTIITETPDKIAIKKAIESGQTVTGATLVENKSIQIK